MHYLEKVLKQNPKETIKTIKRLKQLIKNRNEFYKKNGSKLYNGVVKANKNEKGRSKGGSMWLSYRIPVEVYMSDPTYWDDIIKNKKFDKHPEWKVGGDQNLNRGIITK